MTNPNKRRRCFDCGKVIARRFEHCKECHAERNSPERLSEQKFEAEREYTSAWWE